MSVDYDEMLDRLINGTLGVEGFDHAAHIGTAHAALRRYEFFEAASVFAAGLRSLTRRVGLEEKYNATVTLAFLSLIAERMGSETSSDFVADHGDIGMSELLRLGYEPERLASDRARRVGLLPLAGAAHRVRRVLI